MRRRGRTARLRARASAADHALLAAAARSRGPGPDRLAMLASRSANRSTLWMAAAAALAATGRRRPRSAAASGVLGIALAATTVNGPLKLSWRRSRPPTGIAPLLPLPRTFSFPSGHSASAFAFATGASLTLPASAPVLVPAAATVAWSRVHTGVHYPSDVAVGAAVGTACGALAARIVHVARHRSVHHPEAPPLPMAVPRAAVLVANAGSGTAAALDDVRSALDHAGIRVTRTVDIAEVGSLRGDLDGVAMVIAAGGDGTVGAVAGVVAGTDAILMALPLGTSNDVARSLGIAPDPVEAVAALADGYVGTVDAGEVEVDGTARVFLNAATAGLNVAFAREAGDGALRRRFGSLTYPVAAARAVRRYEPFRCSVEHDGGRLDLDAVHLSVSNAPVFGGLLGMRVPGASMTDGRLDVIAVERLTLTRLVYAVVDAFVGRHRPVRRVHAFTTSALRVRCEDSTQELAVDGELAGPFPARFRMLPGGVRVALPRTP